MPPSEQNPAPMNQPFPNVPEYLHLDPIPEPKAPQSKKKIILILTAIALAVLLAASAAAAWLYMSGEPERRLYGAIENLMSTQYVTQKTVTTFESKTESMVETKYDLTDSVRPKSHSSFMIDTERLSVAGELITFGANEYFIRFTKLPENESKSNIMVDTWYKVEKSNLEQAPELIRSFNVTRIVPPVYGDIILGNLDGNMVKELMIFIRDNSVYAYTAFVNEPNSAVYNLTLDSKLIGELNKKLSKQLDATVPSLYDAMTKTQSFKMKYVLTVNKQTGNVSQFAQVPDDDEKDKSVITTVTYTFPDNVSVSAPDDFKEVVGE